MKELNESEILKNSIEWLIGIRKLNGKWSDEFKNSEGNLIISEGLYALIRAKNVLNSYNTPEINDIILTDVNRLFEKLKTDGFYNGDPYLDFASVLKFRNSQEYAKVDFVDTVSYVISVYSLLLKDSNLSKKIEDSLKSGIVEELQKLTEKIIDGALKDPENNNLVAYTWVFNDKKQDLENIKNKFFNVLYFEPSSYFTYSIVSALTDIYDLKIIENKKKMIKDLVNDLVSSLLRRKRIIKDKVSWSENLSEKDEYADNTLSTIYIFMTLIYAKSIFEIGNRDLDDTLEKAKKYIVNNLNDKLSSYANDIRYLYSQVTLRAIKGQIGAYFIDETFLFEALTALTMYYKYINRDDDDINSLKIDIINVIKKVYNMYSEIENKASGFYSPSSNVPAIYINSPAIDILLDNVSPSNTIEDFITDTITDTLENLKKELLKKINQKYENNKIDVCNSDNLNSILKFGLKLFDDEEVNYYKKYEHIVSRNLSQLPKDDPNSASKAMITFKNLILNFKNANNKFSLKTNLDRFSDASKTDNNEKYYFKFIENFLNETYNKIKTLDENNLNEYYNLMISAMIDLGNKIDEEYKKIKNGRDKK